MKKKSKNDLALLDKLCNTIQSHQKDRNIPRAIKIANNTAFFANLSTIKQTVTADSRINSKLDKALVSTTICE